MASTSKHIKKTLNAIIKAANIVLVAFLCIVLLFSLYSMIARLAFKQNMPKVFGFSNAIIVSPSMSGTIEVDDMIIVKEKSNYKIEDIITFEENGEYVTHRIIDIDSQGKFVTKGDNNDSPDKHHVEPSKVVGKVVLIIPKIGTGINFLKTSIGILIIIFTGVVLLYLPSIINKVTAKKAKK